MLSVCARLRLRGWNVEVRKLDRGHATGRLGRLVCEIGALVGGTTLDALHRTSLRERPALPSPGASEGAPPARRARRASRSLRAARSHRAPRAARRPFGGAPPPPSPAPRSGVGVFSRHAFRQKASAFGTRNPKAFENRRSVRGARHSPRRVRRSEARSASAPMGVPRGLNTLPPGAAVGDPVELKRAFQDQLRRELGARATRLSPSVE